jgi:ABC-type multidrug transport system fused ATPase/permease subunit
MVNVERASQYFDIVPEEPSVRAGPVTKDLSNWPSAGAIEFRNVSMAYRGTSLALRNVSFAIAAGMRVGVVGRTGAGKSSLIQVPCQLYIPVITWRCADTVQALIRMADIASGCITIDRIDIRSIPRAQLRAKVAVIPQVYYTARAAQCSLM